ncbi:MAG: hypothetical protein JWO89_2820 [Verrucomicrobiaceae bacterium]|nr:hypothetical protein [Verrucomicrobiaceae bacterium]
MNFILKCVARVIKKLLCDLVRGQRVNHRMSWTSQFGKLVGEEPGLLPQLLLALLQRFGPCLDLLLLHSECIDRGACGKGCEKTVDATK